MAPTRFIGGCFALSLGTAVGIGGFTFRALRRPPGRAGGRVLRVRRLAVASGGLVLLSVGAGCTRSPGEEVGEGARGAASGTSAAARAPDVDPMADGQLLRGMLAYAAGEPLFAECLTGKSFRVSGQGAYAELERSYREAGGGTGEPVLMSVRGSIAPDSASEAGSAPSLLLVVAFESAEPGGGCGEAVADVPLEGTDWTLVELEGTPVADGVEATLRLDGTDRRASGSSGCNAFFGPYRLEGARLTFGDLALTRKACAPPAADVEVAYLRILGTVGGYRLVGVDLHLLAEEGVAARFRSR
ncbi:MAG: META domain-containing protein [Gemmatimonadetes bacterium]|nr:META domain-containing protein [Gemmatimonadota bacterium]